MKHSPGPWSIHKGDYKGTYYLCVKDISDEEDEANAHLIAACPTMYDYIAKQATSGDKNAIAIINLID